MTKDLVYRLMAIALFALPCHAAEISWSSAFDIETEEDIDISGEIVRAVNVVDPNAIDEIIVDFGAKEVVFEPEHTFEFVDEIQTADGSVTGAGNFYSGQEQALTTDNDDLDEILDSHGWVGGNPAIAEVLLEELQIGTTYQVQLIGAADDRGCCDQRQQTIINEDEDRISELFGRQGDWDEDDEFGPGSVIGTFTADSAEQYIFIKSVEFDDPEDNDFPGNDPGLSAYLLSIPAGAGVEGDFNDNGMRDVGDIDLLTGGMESGDVAFDLTDDGNVDAADRARWVETLTNTFFGDANFDGQFNSSDFVTVFSAAKYETGNAATWAEGDWNGDGLFNSTDFVSAFAGGGYEKGERDGGLQTVPEPSSIALVLLGVVCLGGLRRL